MPPTKYVAIRRRTSMAGAEVYGAEEKVLRDMAFLQEEGSGGKRARSRRKAYAGLRAGSLVQPARWVTSRSDVMRRSTATG
ncbi:hypothetical protein GCM10009565_25370 [Amycolatopsis albidoflavus]